MLIFKSIGEARLRFGQLWIDVVHRPEHLVQRTLYFVSEAVAACTAICFPWMRKAPTYSSFSDIDIVSTVDMPGAFFSASSRVAAEAGQRAVPETSGLGFGFRAEASVRS